MSNRVRTAIEGFHVNDKKRCLKFIDEKEYLIISCDKYWLGDGMYFWDNVENAEYWLNEKSRKKPTQEHIMVRAIVYTDDEFLDLTGPETQKFFNTLWKKYCDKNNESEKQPLGDKINKLIKFFDILSDTKVIRGIGDYNIDQKKFDHFKINNSYTGPQIRGYEKIIYCVKHPELVIERSKKGD